MPVTVQLLLPVGTEQNTLPVSDAAGPAGCVRTASETPSKVVAGLGIEITTLNGAFCEVVAVEGVNVTTAAGSASKLLDGVLPPRTKITERNDVLAMTDAPPP